MQKQDLHVCHLVVAIELKHGSITYFVHCMEANVCAILSLFYCQIPSVVIWTTAAQLI